MPPTLATVKRPPSDFELLRAIYERYRRDFIAIPRKDASTGILLPIDIPAVADDLGADADTVWGRLYYHLEPVYSDPPKVFFTPVAGDERDCVNFPLLEAVLAGLWQERNRLLWAFWTSLVSVMIAIGALVVSIVAAS
jgi:hypothetical protein